LTAQSKQIQIEKEGMQLLKDYMPLLFERPFLTLLAVNQPLSPLTLPETLTSLFTANFIHLEAGANLLSYKFTDDGIDRNSMRELVSFADSCLLSMFRTPKRHDILPSA
ncbi:MAG: hypothetical protein NWF06_04420, partial [Candidatus Bathyarchaeota archaeon]|nr:hypothetical protein [Candidatus Bathyarchaeum sp.]